MNKEVKDWPYSFPASEDFQGSERGSVRGRLLVQDMYIYMNNLPAKYAYVGLAAPGDIGSWQRECKGYQFWVTADEGGNFDIENVRSGSYNIFAWAPSFIGDIEVGDLVYNPLRDGPTLWEIGIPDRSTAKFYIPDPNPKYINKLYANHPDRFRQYGLWERYADLYRDGDLVYTVLEITGKIGFLPRLPGKLVIMPTKEVDGKSTYILRLALASAHHSELQDRKAKRTAGKTAPVPACLFVESNRENNSRNI
ncbi:hypothetical protein RJ639_005680 [Escallonia herrerae]|uniref:Rhamnogalacturonan endolyase n=1 Tax=Escallonia herrerae TaxID=1293975 RepID=A0AA88W2U3_9ASTE|nr:hypothetical protein RJ639_005680 [Escallonia herrerae]